MPKNSSESSSSTKSTLLKQIEESAHLSQFFTKLFSEMLHLGAESAVLKTEGENLRIAIKRGHNEVKSLNLSKSWREAILLWLEQRRSWNSASSDTSSVSVLTLSDSAAKAPPASQSTEIIVRVGQEIVRADLVKSTQLKGDMMLIFSGLQARSLQEIERELGVMDYCVGMFRAALGARSGVLVVSSPTEDQLQRSMASMLALSGGHCVRDAHALAIIDSNLLESLRAEHIPGLLIVGIKSQDALEALFSLSEFGFQPSDTNLVGVVCQAFVRRVCESCARETAFDASNLELLPLGLRPEVKTTCLVGRGCENCGQSGYRGMLGLQSIILCTQELRVLLASQKMKDKAALENAHAAVVGSLYPKGLKPLLEDGIIKLKQGKTTLEAIFEVTRVVPAVYSRFFIEKANVSAEPKRAKIAKVASVAAEKGDESDIAVIDLKASRKKRSKPLLLVVEDDPDQRSILEMVFRSAHYDLQVAEDGLQAFELIHREIPDLIVTDLMMPRMDGREFVSRLKLDENFRNIPVMILTVVADSDKEYDLLDLGADDYCEKTIQRKVLLKRVENLLRRSRG